MKGSAPARMSNDAILAELGDILAAGAHRIRSSIGRSGPDSNGQKALDVSAQSEASCGEPEGTST